MVLFKLGAANSRPLFHAPSPSSFQKTLVSLLKMKAIRTNCDWNKNREEGGEGRGWMLMENQYVVFLGTISCFWKDTVNNMLTVKAVACSKCIEGWAEKTLLAMMPPRRENFCSNFKEPSLGIWTKAVWVISFKYALQRLDCKVENGFELRQPPQRSMAEIWRLPWARCFWRSSFSFYYAGNKLPVLIFERRGGRAQRLCQNHIFCPLSHSIQWEPLGTDRTSFDVNPFNSVLWHCFQWVSTCSESLNCNVEHKVDTEWSWQGSKGWSQCLKLASDVDLFVHIYIPLFHNKLLFPRWLTAKQKIK